MDNNRGEILDAIRPLLRRLDKRIDYPSVTVFDDGTGYVSWSRGGLMEARLFQFQNLEDARVRLLSYFGGDGDPNGVGNRALEDDILRAAR